MRTTVASLAAIGVATAFAVFASAGVAVADASTTVPAGATAFEASPGPDVEPAKLATGIVARMAAPTVPSEEEPLPGIPSTDAGGVDSAGEAPGDSTPGIFTLSSPGPDAVIASRSSIVVNFSCSDPESGIVSCELLDHKSARLTVGHSLTLPDGVYHWQGEAVNGAGLRTTTVFEFEVKADRAAPTITTDYVEPASGWADGTVIVLFEAADDVSGVEAIYVRSGSGFFRGSGATLRHAVGAGEHVLEYWALDRLGNESEHHTITVRSDGIEPEISVVPFGDVNADGEIEVKRGADLDIRFDCTDRHSGIVFCGVPAFAGLSADTDTPGEYSFIGEARDAAGNVATREVHYVVVDEVDEPSVPSGPVNPAIPDLQEPTAATRGGAAASPDSLASTGADPIIPLGVAAFLLLAGTSVMAFRQYRHPRA